MQRILMVDDEITMTDALGELFLLEEIDLVCAQDAATAADLMEAEFYPVILADVRVLTEADGLDLLDSIRRLSPESRVASLTGHATPALEEQLLGKGAELVLHKPIDFAELLRVVHHLLEVTERDPEADGGPVDFGELYANVRKLLHALPGRRYGLTVDETEDIVQKAWCLLMETRSVIRNPKAWLAGTVVNLCKQEIQRKRRKREVEIDVPSIDLLGYAERELDRDNVLIVRQALDRIDPRSRDLCRLIGMENLSYEEVGSRLGLSTGSIGPLYIRAKTTLRNEIVGC